VNSDFWNDALGRILTDVMGWLPSLAGGLGLLLAGWLLAHLVRFVVGGLLRRLGLDLRARRAGASDVLFRSGMDPSASRLLGHLMYWIVLLVFVLAAAESFGVRGLAGTMGALIAYIPKVLAATFILLLGGVIAKVVGEAIGALAGRTDSRTGVVMGQAAHYGLLLVVVLLALDQLGVDTQLLNTVTIVLLSAAAFALAVALGFGSRELARNIMAGLHAKDEFAIGQTLRVRTHTGRLVSIGPVKSVIQTSTGRVSLPNAMLAEEEVMIEPPAETSE
jgi:small-conductance mechanosensitive channel